MREDAKILNGQRLYSHTKDNSVGRPTHQAQSNNPSVGYHHWFLKVSVFLLIICVLIWAGQKISDPRTLPVSTVQVVGNYQHIDHAQLQQAILPYVAKGFLWADTASLQDRLQQLPWVNTVSVRRAWPDRLIVTLSEQQPAARIDANTLVSVQGEKFIVAKNTIPAGLPVFVSPIDGQQKIMLQTYQAMSAVLAPLSLQISALSLDARQSWALQLNNGIVLLIGKLNPLQRLQRFVQVYKQIVNGNNPAAISTIDLRYANGVSVHFKNQNLTKNNLI